MIKMSKMSNMGERGPGIRGSRFLPIGLIAGPAGGIVTALLKNWKLGIFGILLAILGYQNFISFEFLRPFGLRTVPGVIQDVEKAEQKAEVLTEQLAECELGRDKLKDEILATNEQVQKWVDISTKLQNNQTTLSQALIDLKRKSTAELEIILQGPIPQTCKGAVDLLREAVTKGEIVWKTGG